MENVFCKNCEFAVPHATHVSLWKCCKEEKIDNFITGEMTTEYCLLKNSLGKCKDFKEKGEKNESN